MKDLNNLEDIKKLDPKDVLGSTRLFLDQCQQMDKLVDNFSLPEDYQNISQIVFAGMGGSALGAQVVDHLFKKELIKPFYINSDYDLPGFTDQNTLVILSSYSGSTEEILSCFEEAKNKGAKILGLTTGGKLGDILKAENYPVLIFSPDNNPSGQPRLGTGYSVVGTVKILQKVKGLQVNLPLEEVFSKLKQLQADLEDQAKILAEQLTGSIPLIITGENLAGCGHVLRNQFNETAKTLALFAALPELNHHLLEGLKNPPDKKITVLEIKSSLDPEKIQKRMDLTAEVVKQNNLPVISYQTKSSDSLSQALEVLMLGGFLSFYLAMLDNQDPSQIPWVDYFKEKLN